tara:strand:- start:1681 stop:2469 length:789 start_codon:yes stop_codon:yes gene_type:complete
MNSVWRYYDKTARMWLAVIDDQDAIEAAFDAGDPSYLATSGDQTRIYIFQFMIMFGSNGEEVAIGRSLVKTDDTKDEDKPLKWLFEFSPGEYHPMNIHTSACLSIARKNKYKEIYLHDHNQGTESDGLAEWFTKKYDMINLLQTNLYSGTIRSLSPAPIDEEKTWDPDVIDAIGDWDPPEHFCCPMSLSIMKDPVIAADGKSYERYSIESWFCKGKVSSPLTNEKFITAKLYPNINLRSAIEEAIEARVDETMVEKLAEVMA